MQHLMTAPGDFPYRPRARTPVFYGSHDWHSSVQMHWALLRLLRQVPDVARGEEIRHALGGQFTPVALAHEADFIAGPDAPTERPQGWGWALALVHEAASWDHPDGLKWASAMAPLAEALVSCFLRWLPGQVYPVRYGTRRGSAFGLSLAWPFAEARAAAGDPALREAIAARAMGWFSADTMYPADWEPSGDDCLSPALTEAELMSRILPQAEFADWLTMFLPGIEWGRPGHPVHPRGGWRRHRRAGRPAARPERQPRLVLAADRGRAAARRPAGRARARRGPAARQGGACPTWSAATTSWSTGSSAMPY